jgi:polar amino acid transport system substrate-binding protein
MSSRNLQQQFVGFEPSLIETAARLGEFRYRLQPISWDYSISGLIARQYDGVVSMTITENRKRSMAFSVPYLNAGAVIVARSNDPAIQDKGSLSGKAIIYQAEDLPELKARLVNAGCRIMNEEGGRWSVDAVVDGSADALVCPLPVASYYARCYESSKGKLRILHERLTEAQTAIAIRKDDPRTLVLLNCRISAALQSGVVNALEQQWLWA